MDNKSETNKPIPTIKACGIEGLVYHHQCPDECFQIMTVQELEELYKEIKKDA